MDIAGRRNWTRVQLPADFVSASVYTVDAGSAGYIATGMLKDGVTPAVWVSADGKSWHRAALPKSTSSEVVIDGGTALAGGYILSGAQEMDMGCGMSEFIPSLWWSADGSSWTPGKVPGAMPAGHAWMTLNRISDHAVMANAQQWDANGQELPRQVWVTRDGRTWKLVASPSSLLNSSILTNGQRGLIASHGAAGFGAPVISTVDDDLTVTTLSQSGDGPVDSETFQPVGGSLRAGGRRDPERRRPQLVAGGPNRLLSGSPGGAQNSQAPSRMRVRPASSFASRHACDSHQDEGAGRRTGPSRAEGPSRPARA